jgi:hypothetical protein
MKAINEWTLKECIGAMRHGVRIDDVENGAVFIRLSTPMLHDVADRIYELTRWIPVSERLPTEADADQHGYVLVRDADNESSGETYHSMVQWDNVGKFEHFYTITNWKRIDP